MGLYTGQNMFKFNNRDSFFWYLYRENTRSKSTIKSLVPSLEVVPVSLLLTLNKSKPAEHCHFEQYFSIFWCFHCWQRIFIKYPRDQQNPSSILSAEIHCLLKTHINAALLFYSKHQARHLRKLKLSKLLNKYCLDRFKGALITSIFACQKVLWERKMPEVFSEN